MLYQMNTYSDQWINVYMDVLDFRATSNAGYGVLIHYPDGSSGELSGACGGHE